MKTQKSINISLTVLTALTLAVSLLLTFTVSDYYIFNRISFLDGEDSFNIFFVLSQWIKKSGLLLFPLAVFYKKRSCADIAKYVLPVFVIISCATFGGFFDVTMLTENATPAQKVFASINEFMTKPANMALFFINSALYLAVCALLFVRDGWKVNKKSFIWLPFALIAVMPLNIFENFFDISNFSPAHPLWFKNFTVWHFLAIAILAGFTIGCYYFLRKKDRASQDVFLAAGAIVLLIQYHSKDSMLMGDGYNVYYTVFAALPLFICNIGVYIASISVILKKRVLYAISFFVHAVGALTVFVYFGKDEMSNYGIFCSYSILYFCLTHCLLFALSVLPSSLGHYKFKIKDCLIPLAYYCGVIIVAAVASGLVQSFLTTYSYDGYTLTVGEGINPETGLPFDMTPPNYAFTQVCPLPVTLPVIPLTIWKCQLNVLYLILLYVAYVCLFWAFTGAYYAFLAMRKPVLAKIAAGKTAAGEVPAAPIALSKPADSEVFEETAASETSVEETAATDEEKV